MNPDATLLRTKLKKSRCLPMGQSPGQLQPGLGGVLEVNTFFIFPIFFGYRPCKAFDNSPGLFFRQDARG
jgi:hypothetical protein